MLKYPAYSPFRASSRLPGGSARSRGSLARLSRSSFRGAAVHSSGGRQRRAALLRLPWKMSSVASSAKSRIMETYTSCTATVQRRTCCTSPATPRRRASDPPRVPSRVRLERPTKTRAIRKLLALLREELPALVDGTVLVVAGAGLSLFFPQGLVRCVQNCWA